MPAQIPPEALSIGRARGRLSASSFTAFNRCEKQWFLNYRIGLRGPTNPHQVMGIIVEDALCGLLMERAGSEGNNWAQSDAPSSDCNTFEELKKSIERKKMDRYSWMRIEREEEEKWQDKVDYYGDDYTGGYERKEKAMKKIMGPIKRKWIKDYIDMGYKIIDKYKPQIKRHILSQKDKPSQHGWNEILVNQIKVKDVFLLSRNDYPNIKKAAEKIATGQVTVGTPAKFRTWYNKRGGIINESFFGLGAGDVPSPSRKGVKKMKKKGNTSVPYGNYTHGLVKMDTVFKYTDSVTFDGDMTDAGGTNTGSTCVTKASSLGDIFGMENRINTHAKSNYTCADGAVAAETSYQVNTLTTDGSDNCFTGINFTGTNSVITVYGLNSDGFRIAGTGSDDKIANGDTGCVVGNGNGYDTMIGIMPITLSVTPQTTGLEIRYNIQRALVLDMGSTSNRPDKLDAGFFDFTITAQ